MTPYTRYFWKELTVEGILIDAPWATPIGYEHQDEAIVHFHMKFTVDPYAATHGNGLRWHLMKFYGLKADT